MAYTTIDKPSDYFNTKLYTGNDADNHAITGVGFQPDLLWIKQRGDAGYDHSLTDSVRGSTKMLYPDLTKAEDTHTTGVKSYNSDGFTLGTDDGTGGAYANLVNYSKNYVAWNWKAGTSVSGNTTGSGTAKSYSGSVNTDAGFSIIKYIGNDNASQTVPHHLGATPSMVIVKNLDATVDGWMVYHTGLTSGKNIVLNSSDVEYNATASGYQKGINGIPTSTNLTFVSGYASQQNVNGNNVNYIAYCFAEKKGYSKFGSYVGNGSTTDGTFVYTGHSVAWVMIKQSNEARDWVIYDNKRDTFNVGDNFLVPNSSNAEGSGNTSLQIDFLASGFKLRGGNHALNKSGGSYIYMAFAKSPFVTSTGIPTTAR